MRIFKTRLFTKWAKKERLADYLLSQAITEVEQGLVDADLGGDVYKKRISLQGQGKRGGARSIIAYKVEDKAFFIYGYSKNEKANISPEEKKLLKALAKEMLSYSTGQLTQLLKTKKLFEVKSDE